MIYYFKHNNMEDLESVLRSIAEDDVKLRRDALQQRRFIIVEGLYRNTGDICPLNDLIEIKEKYCYRLIMDESLSFGTVGETGRGITEHFGINIARIEIIFIAMDSALGSIGGLCIGTLEIVDHQRLSGAAYGHSASAPPFLSAAASESLRLLRESPDYVKTLQNNAVLLYKGLRAIKGLEVVGSVATPVIHMTLNPRPESLDEEVRKILLIVKKCANRGVGISAPEFPIIHESSSRRASIRVCANAMLTAKQISDAVKELSAAVSSIPMQ
jgi:serine palmitoyltransferase